MVGLCGELIKRDLKIEWSCRSRVDQVDQEVLTLAYQAGCRKIYYGIESSSAEVLSNTSKGIDLRQVREAIRWTREAKISTLGFFMVGNPGDTRESILASIEFAKELRLDYVQVCRTIAKPATQLNDLVIAQTGKDPWRDYVADAARCGDFPAPWTSFSREELEGYVDRFYRAFYFRPSYIVRRILKVRSFEELVRYARVGMRWLMARRTAGSV